ncbi:MAG: DUF6414 family protein [Nocardioides sp.]
MPTRASVCTYFLEKTTRQAAGPPLRYDNADGPQARRDRHMSMRVEGMSPPPISLYDMLRRFSYLDEQTLNDYVGVLEDGLRESRIESSGNRSSKAGSADAKIIKAGIESGTEAGSSVSTSDTPPARFNRLLRLAQESPNASGWIDVVTLDDLSDAGIGALVDFECELEVPDVARLFGSDELNGLADALDSLRSLGGLLGEEVSDLPDAAEVAAMSGIMKTMKSDGLIVVGQDEESQWKIASNLRRELIRGGSLDELSGSLRITGKIGRVINKGEYKMLLGLPGMSLLPRDQRKAMEKKRPDPDEMDMYLEGPARLIDVLAIYR